MNTKNMIFVGRVSDEAGEFYIMRPVSCKEFRNDHKHIDFTGADIEVPGKPVIFGSFIVNRNIYYVVKVKPIKIRGAKNEG